MMGRARRVLHFSNFDAHNGAGKAAWRLHDAMRGAGLVSRLVVRSSSVSDADVVVATPESAWLRRGRRMLSWLRRPERLSTRAHLFSRDDRPRISFPSLVGPAEGGVDVLCVHSATDLLSPIWMARLQDAVRAPLVRVLMDMEPLTGGCHHPLDCRNFTADCGNCFQLARPAPFDQSRKTFDRRRRYLGPLPTTFVAPTAWLADRVRESGLYANKRVEVIPLALDPATYRPLDRSVAREVLRVPRESKVIFFGAYSIEDERKGFAYLCEALERLRSMRPGGLRDPGGSKVRLLIAGKQKELNRQLLPFEHDLTGWLQDELMLALAYQAADVVACPSIYDAGPMMIPEALLCGTPVVAFNTGGAPDVIRHRENGYLARYKDAADLADGLLSVLESDHPAQMADSAREAALRRHAPERVVPRYARLFDELLGEAA